MLWDAGQARIAREQRTRLGEHYRAAVDAGLQVLGSSGRAKPKGAWRLPAYVEPPPTEIERTPETRDRTLAKLAIMFPGIVRRPA